MFAMGFLIAGSFTLAAFTYVSPITSLEDEKNKQSQSDITYLQQEAPKEEEKKEEVIEEVDKPDDTDDTQVKIDIDKLPDADSKEAKKNKDEELKTQVGSKDISIKIGAEDIDLGDLDIEIHEWVDTDAKYTGGAAAMIGYIQNNIIYPEMAIELGIQGKVNISFVVEKDGSVTNVQIEKSDDKALDREAKRIVRSFPNWVPAELNAKKVRMRVRLPIVFTFAN
jgi:protein TonB